jgi:hypothetical protein
MSASLNYARLLIAEKHTMARITPSLLPKKEVLTRAKIFGCHSLTSLVLNYLTQSFLIFIFLTGGTAKNDTKKYAKLYGYVR